MSIKGKLIILIFTKADLVKKQIKMSELNPLLINTKEKKM